MSDPTGAAHELDTIRAKWTFVGICQRQTASGKGTPAEMLAELRAALDDLPADRREAAIRALARRMGGP